MIKVYTSRAYMAPDANCVVMLMPFWGKGSEDPQEPEAGRFDRYIERGQSFFELTSLHDADLAVAPSGWEVPSSQPLTQQLVAEARSANKRTLIFYWSDYSAAVPFAAQDTLVLRTSVYRSRHKPYEFAMPAWSEDFVAKYLNNRLPLRQKADKPTIGFCGFATFPTHSKRLTYALKQAARTALQKGSDDLTRGHIIRGQALQRLSNSKQIVTNFIVRDQFLAGAIQPDGQTDMAIRRISRTEYLQNMIDSDYVLCARGAGNFSYRLYETLSCGRIPVFISTDCVLPYDFKVDWKKYCVWIDEPDLPQIAERVLAFHESLSPQAFIDYQQECRQFWKKWLCPEGFFEHFHHHLMYLEETGID